MYLIRFKRNIGTVDMVIRIILGSVLIALGAVRALPGGVNGAAIAVIAGVFLLVEGAVRY